MRAETYYNLTDIRDLRKEDNKKYYNKLNKIREARIKDTKKLNILLGGVLL